MALRLWELHGDGRTVTPGAVVRPEERLSWRRLSWRRSAGIGVENRVDLRDPLNLMTAAVALIVGAANDTLSRVLRGLGGAPVLGEGAIASPAAGTAPATPPAREPDPRDRPPREP